MELKGAEIMAVGTWTGEVGGTNSFSVSDLDALVSSFDTLQLSGRVPLKFGHNTEQPMADGQPALGWVDKIYRQGEKLLADFVSMPQVVYDAIKAGLYKFVSVEMLGNVRAGTRRIPWVLDAVALLGADQPAVGTLKDLQALTMRRPDGLHWESRVAFRRGDSSGGQDTMADDTDVAALRKRLAELEAANTAKDTELKTVQAKAANSDAAERRVKELETERHKEKVELRRKELDQRFEAKVKAGEILPAVKERFVKFFKVNTDDVLLITDREADEYIKEHRSARSTGAATLSADPDKLPVDTMPDDEMGVRVARYCRDNGMKADNYDDQIKATVAILRTDGEFAVKYKNLYAPVST
jgi:hypothetical protein